jgi:hypothetical protein
VYCLLCERPLGDAYLCPSCSADLADRLGRLPALYAALGSMLAPERGGEGGRTAAAVEAPLPLRPDVADQRADFAVLEVWARALAQDRQQPAPAPVRDDLGARVAAACTALAAAVPWIAAAWPAAEDLAREVKALHDDARSIVGTADLPARMGRCPTLVHGQPCGAELLLPSGAQVLTCPWCGARFPPGTWGMLKVEQRKAAQAAAGAAAARPSHPSATVGSG